MTIEGALSIIVGLVLCFMGYSIFRSMLPLWGFIIGGLVGISLLAITTVPPGSEILYQIGAFVIGGIIGAAVAVPFYYIVVFILGAALGAIAGRSVGVVIDAGGHFGLRQVEQFTSIFTLQFAPETGTQLILMLFGAVVLGVMAIGFQKTMIILSSALVGAAALVNGIAIATNSSITTNTTWLLILWAIVGVVGLVIQTISSGDDI